METRQLDTGIKLAYRLYREEWITQMQFWEIEGALIDIYNQDDWDFFHSMGKYAKEKATEILYTIGYLI